MQLDSRLSRAYEGTGLGLALVARLTALHGGEVTVTSALGQGSRFTVTLPWQLPAAATARNAVAPSSAEQVAQEAVTGITVAVPQSPALILLAEDNEANSHIVAEYLELQGHQVVLAFSGIDAVQLVRAKHPDIILMDIQMPGIDGLEATRRIRAQGFQMPIIALTALAMPGDQERCLAAGATAYLAKPVSLRTIGALVATLLPTAGAGGSQLAR